MKVFLIFLCLLTSIYAEVYKVYTEQLPPYNCVENNKIVGRSTELLRKVLEKNGDKINGQIELGAWAKGYHAVLNNKNTILYSTARTTERESMFKWVGPVDTMTIGIIAKKSKKMVIKDTESLHQYKIAAMYETASEGLLLSLGLKVEELDRFTNVHAQIRKLQEDRIDALAYGVEAVYQLIFEAGLDPLEYETVYVLKKTDLYFAFNNQTSDAQINALNRTLKMIKAEKQ